MIFFTDVLNPNELLWVPGQANLQSLSGVRRGRLLYSGISFL